MGPAGKDGQSVTMEAVQDWLEAKFANWALGVERRIMDEAQKAIDRMPKPKDGKDGVTITDFEFDGERRLRCRKADGQVVEVVFPTIIDRGIFTAERTGGYERGDAVSFGGSTWFAQRSTKSRPGTDDSWRLAVKKGRDAHANGRAA